ncbi:hypothetical protein FLONG3_61 [Fusarium longipes]|uniref:Heterokaryon incompatibility domain-containing protein n=1 Tax=Fusarium longipes TaxID=694270 RepID=A0A395TAT6_9HYPO|nr:hypothetical protein FLONG3_61 [Fusarium longipes]
MATTQSPRTQSYQLRGHTCVYCCDVDLCASREALLLSTDFWDKPHQERRFTHYALSNTGKSLADLETGIRSGCDFSSYLVSEVRIDLVTDFRPEMIKIYSDDWNIYDRNFYFILLLEHAIQAPGDTGLDVSGRYVAVPLCTKALPPGVRYRLTADPGISVVFTIDLLHWLTKSDIAKDLDGRVEPVKPMAANPLDESTIASIQDWRRRCSREQGESGKTHKICSLSSPKFVPSRLIQVRLDGTKYRMNIVERQQLPSDLDYTALSYCWGVDRVVTLRNDNIGDFKNNIPWEIIPKTIQDAAMVTAKLNILYLWVDSFCILQDNQLDKHREISKMTLVYTHAELTIVAKRARYANEGFLHDRSPPSGMSEMVFRHQDRQAPVTLTFKSPIKDQEIVKLDSRGWILQEYLLSTRLLVIGTWVTQWTCRKDRGPSSHLDGWELLFGGEHNLLRDPWQTEDPDLEDSQLVDAVIYSSLDPRNHIPEKLGPRAMATWTQIVEEYTLRELKEPSDRILAISGIAKCFSSVFGMNYYAGLWPESLPYQLCWRSDATEKHPRRTDRGPSWSWTSISGPVRFGTAICNSCAEIHSITCEPVIPEAPFGAVKSGSGILRIKGPAIDVQWMYSKPNTVRENDNGSYLRYLDSDGTYVNLGGRVYLDTQEPDSEWTPVSLLATDPGDGRAHGLVLRIDENYTFRRLGTFTLSPLDSLTKSFSDANQWERRDFTII